MLAVEAQPVKTEQIKTMPNTFTLYNVKLTGRGTES